MAEMQQLPHLIVVGSARTADYSPRRGGPRPRYPQRDRPQHADRLLEDLQGIHAAGELIREERVELGLNEHAGLLLVFESSPEFDLKFESLDLRSKAIQLLSVRKLDDKWLAVCYVPDGQLEHFVTKIEQYRNEETRQGKAKE